MVEIGYSNEHLGYSNERKSYFTTNIFTIHRIEKSSLVYAKHVLLEDGSKATSVYYSSNQRLLLFLKKYFSLHFYRKRINKKYFQCL